MICRCKEYAYLKTVLNFWFIIRTASKVIACLLYTSDAADDMQCVDLGGRRIIKKSSVCVTVV